MNQSMANAQASVKRAAYGYRSENLTHSYGTISVVTQLYAGAMVGLNAGYLAHFDDTASMSFFGLLKEKEGNPKLPFGSLTSGTAGDGTLDLDTFQPKYFELNIVGVAITDIGRAVYALDDETGTLDPSATTYANLVGVVKDLVYATDPSSPVANYAKVQPTYGAANGRQLQVLTTAAPAVQLKRSLVILNKAGVIAATLANPTAGAQDGLDLSLVSVVAQAHTLVAPGGFNGTGTTATWGGAKGDSLQVVAFGGLWFTEGSPRNITFS